MFVLWDIDGNKVEVNFPEEPPVNLLEGDNTSLDFDLRHIISQVESLSGSPVITIYQIGTNHYSVSHSFVLSGTCPYLLKVFDMKVSAGQHFIARISNSPRATLQSSCEKLTRECVMMSWMSSVTSIPIPKVHICDPNPICPHMISDKCEGEMIVDAFGLLSEEAKVCSIVACGSLRILFYAS